MRPWEWSFIAACSTFPRAVYYKKITKTLRLEYLLFLPKDYGQDHACGADVRFTLYPEADHLSWVPAYADPALYDWLSSAMVAGLT